MKDKIKILCSIETIRFYKKDFGILVVSIDEVQKGEPITNKDGYLILKGIMPQPIQGEQYCVNAVYTPDSKWGDQYTVVSILNAHSLNVVGKDGQRKFLTSIFTPNQINEMYKVLDDPYAVLEKKDYSKLVKVKGCALKNAVSWVNRFEKHVHLAKVYVELQDYNLTNNMLEKLLNRYNHSPDLVIQKVKENPYTLVEIDGIGWGTADKIALDGGINPYGEERVEAYIKYYLEERGLIGYSWITPDELLGAVLDNIGEEVKDETITAVMGKLNEEEYLIWNEDKTRIGLLKYYEIEKRIAEELIRLRDAESNFKYSDWRDAMKHLEHKQGWNYSEEQVKGIETVLKNNVCVVYGEAGTGKSTLVAVVLEALRNYSFAQTALAGRAASRLSEVTGDEGYTIHRLLGYPCYEEGSRNGFAFHEYNPLKYDVIILDEISMVDARLFSSLLQAIKSGSKLIMLGDIAQLECIGSGNVAHDMINSSEIPTVYLSEIHRQAAGSAIITESRKIRRGQQIIEKDWTGDVELGEYRDLNLHCFSDRSNTYYKIMQCFSKAMAETKDILEVQVIVPVKDRGEACTWVINNAIQELYNPPSKKKEEIEIRYGKKVGILREGDKVMCVKNNYKTNIPVFNGNIGILNKIFEGEEELMLEITFIGIGVVVIPYSEASSIELAYAITCHKMQGSQASHVIFGIDFSSYSLLTRELVYTGITRAKKKCDLIAETNALRMATSCEGVSKKQTYLQECLDEITHPKLIF